MNKLKKNILVITMICLLLCTVTYTYSAFRNTIEGTINATTNSWVFKLNVDGGTKEEGYYMVPITKKSGTFNITVDNTNSKYGASYVIKLEPINLPNDIVETLTYDGKLIKDDSETINVKYNSSSIINGYIKVKIEAKKYEYAVMSNGHGSTTAFWNYKYQSYIKTIEFNNNLDNLPSSCTEENLCWNIAGASNKVYGYLLDSGEMDNYSNTIYNLYITSYYDIYAPVICRFFFSGFSNLESIEFNKNFNTSKVRSMECMFYGLESLTGLDLSSFDTSRTVLMNQMFDGCSSLVSLDLSNFNTSRAKNMGSMFRNCSKLKDLDLSSFDTSSVTNMSDVFNYCKSLTTLDLSNFDTSNVTTMIRMFNYCESLSNLNLNSFNTSNVTDMTDMFINCKNLNTEINIMTSKLNIPYLFNTSSSVNEGAKITINYIADASEMVDKIIGTKGSSSNIVKGDIIAEPTIKISDNSDIRYECMNRLEKTPITLIDSSGNNYVTSFKMNGTLIEGNTFIMPDTDVTITDITTVECITIESDHYPYLASQSDVVIGEQTFENATGLTIILDYQTELTSSSYLADYFIIEYYNNGNLYTNRYGGSTKTQEKIIINGNYIKITFTSDNNYYNNYFGLRAIVIPNY